MFKNFPQQTRSASLQAESFDEKRNTVDVVFTSGAAVKRWGGDGPFMEELATGAENVRLGRLNLGAPFLNTHDSGSLSHVLGSVVPGSARMDGGVGYATIQLTKRADAAGVVQDIRDGVIRNTSVGYRYHKIDKVEGGDPELPVFRVMDWEPLEISAVPIPADALSQIRSESDWMRNPTSLVFPALIIEKRTIVSSIEARMRMARMRVGIR